jgi:DNA-binding transcriptional LysR family regulator
MIAVRLTPSHRLTVVGNPDYEGLGLAQVPEPIAAGAVKVGKLVCVLEPFAPRAPGVFLYYPGNRQ